MIDSIPKIEERRVIKKEISEYAPTCALISCVLFFFIWIFCINNLNSEHLFL